MLPIPIIGHAFSDLEPRHELVALCSNGLFRQFGRQGPIVHCFRPEQARFGCSFGNLGVFGVAEPGGHSAAQFAVSLDLADLQA